MSDIKIKKINKTGSNTAVVLLPKDMIDDLGIKFGDLVTIEKVKNQIIIKKINLENLKTP